MREDPILGEARGDALGLGAERKALPPTRPPDLAARDSSGRAVEVKRIPHNAATKAFCATTPPGASCVLFSSLLARFEALARTTRGTARHRCTPPSPRPLTCLVAIFIVAKRSLIVILLIVGLLKISDTD